MHHYRHLNTGAPLIVPFTTRTSLLVHHYRCLLTASTALILHTTDNLTTGCLLPQPLTTHSSLVAHATGTLLKCISMLVGPLRSVDAGALLLDFTLHATPLMRND